jgi:hypothetical protein
MFPETGEASADGRARLSRAMRFHERADPLAKNLAKNEVRENLKWCP